MILSHVSTVLYHLSSLVNILQVLKTRDRLACIFKETLSDSFRYEEKQIELNHRVQQEKNHVT